MEAVVRNESTALSYFYDELAHKPWCGDDKSANLVRPKDTAVKKRYIAPNPPTMVHWLVFDLDHNNPLIWEDKHIPAPNLIVQNRNNLKAHLYYRISPVCISEGAREKPIVFMESVVRGMAKALRSDQFYCGRVAKNPLSSHWRTTELHHDQFNLIDLADCVDFVPKKAVAVTEANDTGRNVSLFTQLRYWAYEQVTYHKQNTNIAAWEKAVLSRALDISTIEADFGYNEIKNTAKSVSKWVWNKYRGSRTPTGVMNLTDLKLDLKSKQRLAARRTNELRSNATEARIIAAIEELTVDSTLPSKAAVAACLGISRQQIYRRYSHLFRIAQTEPSPQEVQNNKQKCNQRSTSDNSLGREILSDKRRHIQRDNKKGGYAAPLSPPFRGLDRAARQRQRKVFLLPMSIEKKDEGD